MKSDAKIEKFLGSEEKTLKHSPGGKPHNQLDHGRRPGGAGKMNAMLEKSISAIGTVSDRKYQESESLSKEESKIRNAKMDYDDGVTRKMPDLKRLDEIVAQRKKLDGEVSVLVGAKYFLKSIKDANENPGSGRPSIDYGRGLDIMSRGIGELGGKLSREVKSLLLNAGIKRVKGDWDFEFEKYLNRKSLEKWFDTIE